MIFIEEKFEEFKKELKQYNLIIKDIVPDGNCLFRAISYFIYGTEEKHKIIR